MKLKTNQFWFTISMLRIWILVSCTILLSSPSFSQTEIPIGTWRMHISYNAIHSIAIGNTKIYGAAPNSIMVFDRGDNSVSTYSKINGLTDTGISCINFDLPSHQLFIAYENGNIDIIQDNVVTNFNRLKNSTEITGSKKINHITIRDGLAYLSADFGVVVFDLSRLEVQETWRDLGAGGSALKIYGSTFLGDSIFLATEKGVLAGNIHTNLLDFNNWKRFIQNDFNGPIQSITSFNDIVYSAIDNSGLHHYQNGGWTKELFLQNKGFQSLSASQNNLLITEGPNLWKLNNANTLTQVVSPLIQEPLSSLEDSAGKTWIGDNQKGLVSDVSSAFSSYLPNGPVNSTSLRLHYHNNTVYAMPGGYSSSFQALGNANGFDSFSNGLWSNQNSSTSDLTDVGFVSGSDKFYVSSFGYGLEERDVQGSVQLYDENNSPLININPPGRFVNLTSIQSGDQGLWVANYAATQSLHLLKSDNTWESFSFPNSSSRYPTELEVDVNNNVWMVLNPSQGGGILVFDKDQNKTAYLTDIVGAGGLPSKAVRSIAMDRDGYVWVGTDAGVAYFIDLDVFSPGTDAVKPIFENRYLLKSEKVTAIAVDGGNRKWMGTERGVWLFNPTGEALVYNFTTENSPLLSNVIQDIEINSETGEVFFATDKGIISFRSDATESENTFQGIKIFPNPVTANFTGTVGISGLATDAIVKITNISGKMIWQTQANGGTATWNVHDTNGNKASTGIYLVFAATADGAESIVGKIAVVN